MSTLLRAAAVIRNAEQELRTLLTEVASVGEYDAIVAVADLARQLAALAATLPVNGGMVSVGGGEDKTLPAVKSKTAVNPTPATNNGKSIQRKAKSTKRRGKPGPNGEYPKFLRRNDELVKIGWSKSDKAPYEHKAPKAVVAILVLSLVRAGEGGRQFAMDDLLPLKQTDGAEVPSYQAYLALAWIRAESLVTQHGRQGYSLIETVDLPAEVERRWAGLPTR